MQDNTMHIVKGFSNLNTNLPRSVVTIGNFDGIHQGHRQIIEAVVKRAKEEKGTSVVYTFRPHPQEVLSPASEIQLLNTYDEKLEILADMGVDVVIEEPFSREFSSISAEKFFSEVLVKRLSACAIYIGYDFGFGKDRAGSLDILKEFCKNEGVELYVIKPFKVGSGDGAEVCSSSRIRNYITAGDVARANLLLGREFFYRGLVVRGNGRGKKIGFATANVHTENKLKVKEGVYATRAVFKGQSYASVTNVGRQPTFNKDVQSPIVVETHLFDFDQDIYGETLEVRIVERLRDEVRFSGIEQLVAQIKLDSEKAKKILSHDHSK
jgi:riboflavin kinase / FMN adenylyltransferase